MYASYDHATNPNVILLRRSSRTVSINTKSTTHFPMSLTWTLYVVPKPPRGTQNKFKLSKNSTIIGNNIRTARDRSSVTINNYLIEAAYMIVIDTYISELELWLLFCVMSPNSLALQADYVTVVEDRPIMSAKYCLTVAVFHFLPKLTHHAVRSLCDSWVTCSQQQHWNEVPFSS